MKSSMRHIFDNDLMTVICSSIFYNDIYSISTYVFDELFSEADRYVRGYWSCKLNKPVLGDVWYED